MTILIVGNNGSLLDKLKSELLHVYPDAKVVAQNDPLMGGKYSFSNDVDMLITEINMKRMSGLQLIEFVRQEKPDVLTYLVGTKDELNESPAVVPEDATGVILYPFTETSLKKVLNK